LFLYEEVAKYPLMNNYFDLLRLLENYYLIVIFEILLALFFLGVLLKDRNARKRSFMALTRGKESRKKLNDVASFAIALISIELVSLSGSKHSFLFGLLNLVVLSYLLILSPWFRNKLTGLLTYLENRSEPL
jgi:hypothetical protein